jgi:hypothetical protein
MDVVDGVRVRGPLAAYARGLVGELARLGFSRGSAQKQLQLAAHVSRWLGDTGLDTAELNARAVDGFLAARRAAGHGEFITPKALAPLLGYLRGLAVAPQPELVPRVYSNRISNIEVRPDPETFKRTTMRERTARPSPISAPRQRFNAAAVANRSP